jgi:hypothetical protein
MNNQDSSCHSLLAGEKLETWNWNPLHHSWLLHRDEECQQQHSVSCSSKLPY